MRLSVGSDDPKVVGRRLAGIDGVYRVIEARSPDDQGSVISADVEPGSADELLALLQELGVEDDGYVVTRYDVVAPISARRVKASTGFAWLEVLGEARTNSRPLARYLTMMLIAGVIAALGVLESNEILIVGAMAVSPDLLPVCATCVAIIAGRGVLLSRSLATLGIGLFLTATSAAAVAFFVSVAGFIPSDFDVATSSIKPLAAVTDYSTVLVALAAGVAAMISFETRASAAVGVAISVTTIPASAYLGVAFATGEAGDGLGALLVLVVNVFLLMVSGTTTLWIQRLASRRAERLAEA